MDHQYLYVFSNPAIPGLIKIGSTRKHPLRRAAELAAPTAVPGEFILEYFRMFADAFEAESTVHAALADHRYSDNREFFSVSVGEAVALIDSLNLPSNGETGGEYTKPVVLPDLSFSELFASFPDRGDGVLNAEEQAACRALEARHP